MSKIITFQQMKNAFSFLFLNRCLDVFKVTEGNIFGIYDDPFRQVLKCTDISHTPISSFITRTDSYVNPLSLYKSFQVNEITLYGDSFSRTDLIMRI